MTTVKVPGADGKVSNVEVFTVAQVDALIADNKPESRKTIMDHMKALGRPVNELVKMKGPERREYILARYAELGVGGTAVKKGKTAPTAAAPAAGKKGAPAKAPEPEAEDDDTDTDTETAGEGVGGAEIAELKELIEAQGAQLAELGEKFNELAGLVLDAHHIIRATLPMVSGLDEADIVGLKDDYFGKILVEAGGDDEGND